MIFGRQLEEQDFSSNCCTPSGAKNRATSAQWQLHIKFCAVRTDNLRPRLDLGKTKGPRPTGSYAWKQATFKERRKAFRISILFLSSHKSNECLLRSSLHTASHCNKAKAVQKAFKWSQASLLVRSTLLQRC